MASANHTERVVWRRLMVPLDEYIDLPKDAVVIGICFAKNDKEYDYLYFLIPATDSEIRMYNASDHSAGEYAVAYNEVIKERAIPDGQQGVSK